MKERFSLPNLTGERTGGGENDPFIDRDSGKINDEDVGGSAGRGGRKPSGEKDKQGRQPSSVKN